VLAATGTAAITVWAGGCGGDDPVDPPATTTGSAPAAVTTAEPSLPEVASAAPQPDPVAGTLGDTVTVTGKDLFGKKSATIEVTLGKPRLLGEVKYPKTGAVQKPKRGAFVVFDVAIEGIDGTYEFNPRHFHLIPRGQVESWRSEAVTGLDDRPDVPTQIDALNSISFGSVSAGDRISGSLVFDQPRSAVNDAAVVLRALLLTDGPPSAHWSLA
jgi:hypothetical protein